MERIDRKAIHVRRIAELTGVSYSRAARLLRYAAASKLPEKQVLLALIFAGRARKSEESDAFRLAGEALRDPEAERILSAYLTSVRKARKYLKTCQDPEVSCFLETTMFGNWRRSIKS